MMNKRLVILGAGESGVGAAVLGHKLGYDVFVSDSGQVSEKYKAELEALAVDWEEKTHTVEKILSADLVVKSPGIPEKVALVQTLIQKGIPVISEIEFAGQHSSAKMICVTGSNGKTTTSMLIHDILVRGGLNVGLAGNIGFSLARQVAEKDFDCYVVEISSFQLDGMYNFKADIAILTNITPDHLDRYDGKFEKYVKSKFRIVRNQTEEDMFIYCQDDKEIEKVMNTLSGKAQLFPFTLEGELAQGAGIKNDNMQITIPNKSFQMSLKDLALKGKHNVYNSMAAGISAMAMNIKNETIREALSDFKGVEHRLEKVVTVRGIEFINDSKATNVNSTWYALECMTKPVVWIAGGTDKGNDYKDLLKLASQKVRALVCLGVDNEKLKQSFKDYVPTIVEVDSMDEAIKSAYFLAKKGDAVLLSPACASFDLFKNYEDRGTQFKTEARKL